MKIDSPAKLDQMAQETMKTIKEGPELVILVSMGTCGIAAGAKPVYDAFQKEIEHRNIQNEIQLVETGCLGVCHSEPSIEVVDRINGNSILYGKVKPEKAVAIIESGLSKADGVDTVKRTWYYPEKEEKPDCLSQARIVLRNTGHIDAEKIEDYIVNEGYTSLAKVLTEMTPQEVIDIVETSGIRGRGGGGFPTGRKWKLAAAQNSDVKYIICNADEGDPGAFMDRAVLEGDPHAVVEAMTIAGYAIGANFGIIYIRAEYPLAIKRLKIAIGQAKEHGLIGENIMNSGFNFDLDIRYGAGAFVCGEETALIRSIEGKRGTPRYKPPYPVVSGLWAKPTVVNNVETFANIPTIIRKGADWFRSIGTKDSPGTKVFALAGKIKKVGLIEVPMGTKLRDIIYDIGGGIVDDKEFKAVQTGGPSGGCITKDYIDTEIDYQSLKNLDSMMGSGGMIVMDENDCMVNIAKYFINFTMDESCGKCTPCRVGSQHIFKILDKITKGMGTEKDLETLKILAEALKTASCCGLGMTAPNPVLSTMKYFENEYLEHIRETKCRAKRCLDLITFSIDPEKCTGCALCQKKCPVLCISGEGRGPRKIDSKVCIRCGACFDVCRVNAVIKS